MNQEDQQNRLELEQQIKNEFSELQKKLDDLKNELQTETDATKKQEKNDEIQKMESDLLEMKNLIDRLSALQLEDLQSLKTRLEEYVQLKQDTQGELTGLGNELRESQETSSGIKETPTTYELLEGTNTYTRLENIINNNPEKFINIPGNTAQEKVKYIFDTIRDSAKEFLENRLGKSERVEKIINNTIAPALEWNLLELLTKQKEGGNGDMLSSMDRISFNSLGELFRGVRRFARKSESSTQMAAWMNAIDYLAVQESKISIFNYAENSEILSNPLKFREYLNNNKFATDSFSPHEATPLSDVYALFGIDESKTFDIGISEEEVEMVRNQLGDIEVENVDNVATIGRLVGKAKDFLGKTPGLQDTANRLLDGLDNVNRVTKIFGVDILGEINKSPEERGFLYRVLDFVFKLIGFTGGLEGVVKNWRLNRLNLGDKTENIKQIFKDYHDLVGDGTEVSVTDENSCKAMLEDFKVTDTNDPSRTKGDYLRDAMVKDIDVSLLSPAVVQQTLGNSYLKKEKFEKDGKVQDKIVVDVTKFTEDDKLMLAQKHLQNMKSHLEKYNENNLKDFYAHIHNTDDIAVCVTASLYADKDDVIEGLKAQVFLPENYGVVYADSVTTHAGGRENLDGGIDTSDKQRVSEQRVYDKAVEYGITDNAQIAYVLSTISGESGFKNQKEIGGENRDYGKVDSVTGKAYYGRGFIQITHKGNYEKYTQIVRNSGRDFKDNDGNIIKCSDIDLVNNPDIILQSNDLAIFIAMDWMKNGGPYRAGNKRLDYYINGSKQDFYNARIIINGMTSKPEEYEARAKQYLDKLSAGTVDATVDSKEILIGPKLLAHNKDEIGGIGNSIMTGFQGYYDKLNFPNMNGKESMNTQNHPDRFNSLLSVQSYKASHPNVKSFMFYFGANTQDNERTLSDIKQWSERFQEEGIQPVLCTCIGEDNHAWLTDLNKSIRDLGKEKNWPVFDFAKSYNEGNISMGSGDSPHPTSEGYSAMADLIREHLK